MGAANKTFTKVSTTSSESISSVLSSLNMVDFTDLNEGFNADNNCSLFLYPPITTQRTRKTGVDIRYFRKSHAGRGYNFLHACYLCKRTIGRKHDIFMYRGDIPFCSEECREEQIEMDMALQQIHNEQKQNKKQILILFNQSKCWSDDDSTLNGGTGNMQNLREKTAIVAS